MTEKEWNEKYASTLFKLVGCSYQTALDFTRNCGLFDEYGDEFDPKECAEEEASLWGESR